MSESLNSLNSRFYADLVCTLILDDPLSITTRKSLERDCQTVRQRTSAEGISFLSKTLASLGKALHKALEDAAFTPTQGFRAQVGWSTPAFMQEYFKAVFDCDGRLREDADPRAIQHLVNVLFAVYKVKMDYSKDQTDAVLDGFVKTEEELQELELGRDDSVLQLASHLVDNVFSTFDEKDITPRHGPGSVATGEKSDGKWLFSRLYDSIHQVYPYYDYFVVGKVRELVDRLGWYRKLERMPFGTAKVVLVPKDSRGPRLISAEPLEYQYIQQGLGRKLMSHLEAHALTRGHVNFSDQEVNRQLALESSRTREYATLDMKDASDRVSLQLVERLFHRVPHLLRALKATRTAATTLPDGRVVHMKKFAPMGSALCFPIEAVTFWALIVAHRSVTERIPLREAAKAVFVYGDDLVVPTAEAAGVADMLERYGLKVNRAKCCIQGHFRESCGMDAFRGHSITPVRARVLWTGDHLDAESVASFVALRNAYAKQGYKRATALLDHELELRVGQLPWGTADSPFLCKEASDWLEAERRNFALGIRSRWRDSYQRWEFRVRRITSGMRETTLDGWPRLLRDVLVPQTESDPSKVVLPHSTIIKWGWAPI